MRQQRPEVHRCVEVRRALALLVLVVCAGTACSDDQATASNSASQTDGATAPSGSTGRPTSAARDSGVRSESGTMPNGSVGANGDAGKPSSAPSGSGGDASAGRDGSKPSPAASDAGVDGSAPDGAASTASSGLPEVYVCQAMLAAHPPDPLQPKEPAPASFKPCGVYENTGPSAGVCMPKVLADASNNPAVDLLPQDICSDSEVCMPNLKAADSTACFKPCETSALVQAAGSKEGGCIPPYIAAFTNPEAIVFLEQGKCAEGELCAPCLDPTKDFAVSGACN